MFHGTYSTPSADHQHVNVFEEPMTQENRWPTKRENDFQIRNFEFSSGERLDDLRLHYATLGHGTGRFGRFDQ